MKLVEVVSGLETEPAVAAAIEALSAAWGKVPVHARSTPGFIVNRIARPYYAEALMLLQERAADPARIDACLRAAGFRMGPCELMDLIGHDTNFAVTQSLHAASFGDGRYLPSQVQRELVEAGRLGRKSGRGFYDYRDGAPAATQQSTWFTGSAPPQRDALILHGRGFVADRIGEALHKADRVFARAPESGWVGLSADGAELRLTDGRPATRVSAETGMRDVAVFDLPIAEAAGVLAWSCAATASRSWRSDAPAWLALLGFEPVEIEDAAGLVVARTVAMLINEASDAVQQGVCSAEAVDLAMKLGVNYPAGPFEWLERWGAVAVERVLHNLDAAYRGDRYRASPYLLRRAWTEGMA
jgi:3-hydroxybutyryl-CoA dehydrogenase